MLNAPTCHREASIDEKVAFLRRPEAHAGRLARVEVIETHMSWVFLTDTLVYKLKKPVRYDFLDFSTLDARHLDCEREVILNRRLAPDVYRRTVPLTVQGDGMLQLDGPGIVVEWLVEMRRLPADRMLDAAIRARTVRTEDIRNLTRVLVDFYRGAPAIAMLANEYRERFAADIRSNHAELSSPSHGLGTAVVDSLAASQQRFLREHAGLIEQRARDGRIVDAHGDLRPEHICLTAEPRIIDCLEFNREFRLLDPVDELSYLAMECERLGDVSVGAQILARYLDATCDVVPDLLSVFYKTFRAYLRARIAIAHIADHAVNDAEKWRRRANDYLRLAAACARHW
jgi:aminoglycoside phosphotransferase family enzyme